MRRAALLALLAGLAVVAAVCGGVLATPSGRAGARLGLAIPGILAALPFNPVDPFSPEIRHEVVEYDAGGTLQRAHIWRPDGGRHPGLILSLGVNPAPPEDPRVIRLCEGLAKLGLTVMLLQSAQLDADIVEPAEIDRMVGAFEWLERQTYAGPQIGMSGFSVGASLLTVAAADERIRDRVAVVNAFGGYGSLRRLALDTVSRSYVEGPRLIRWEPDDLTVRLIRLHLANRLEPGDRDLLLAAMPGAAPPGPEPDFRTDAARRVWRFLAAQDRDFAEVALGRLPADILAGLDALSPSGQLDGLRGVLYVMHDKNDRFVPVGEALKVAVGARPLARVHLTEFDLFQHVDVGSGNPALVLRESAKLFWHLYRVLGDLGV